MKYIDIQPEKVIDKIKEGRTVYVIDRFYKEIICLSDLLVETFVEYLKRSESTEDISFYVESEEIKK